MKRRAQVFRASLYLAWARERNYDTEDSEWIYVVDGREVVNGYIPEKFYLIDPKWCETVWMEQTE